MKELSRLAKNVNPSTTLAIDAMAKQMRADGLDVIGFGAGEPDFETPVNIQDAAIDAIRKGKTKYTPAAGIVELRKAAAARLKADCGVDYDYTQIVIASGAKHNVYIALATLINPGDEIIVPAPYWVSYCEMVSMLGGTPVPVLAEEKQHFKITAAQLEAAITDKTKAVMLNNPCNPTGMFYTKSELEALAEVCVKHDLYVIADEIYYQLLYDGLKFTSFASLGDEVKERTILINGVSKSYAMTGWRLGYAAGPAPLVKVMTKIHQSCIMSAPTTSQYAAITALRQCDDQIEMMRDEYNRRRRYVVKALNEMGLTCFEPRGAFYVFPSIQISGLTSSEFCEQLLREKEVAIIPGSAFGASGEGYARISYAYSVDHLQTAMKRIREFLTEHGWIKK